MKYDVVIVGGGAAGSVLASRLAENANTSVLLLEAGPDYPDPAYLPDEIKFGHTSFAESPDSEHNWALRGTITEEQGEIHVAQGKVIGGGSSINGQAMQRGLPEDFDSWSGMGNDEWSYDKVLPYFRKSEHDLDIRDDFHGTGRTDASKASSIRALDRHPKGLPLSLFGGGLWGSRGYQWPEPLGRWRVALEQPGRLEDERCYHSPKSHAPPS